MNKIKQTSLDQTGIVIYETDNSLKTIPLFSLTPMEEATQILVDIEKITHKVCNLKHVFVANNLLDYRVEDAIKNFVNTYNFLPENLMDELVSGFPFIQGYDLGYTKMFYC